MSLRQRIDSWLPTSAGVSSGFFFALMNIIVSAKLGAVSPFVLLFTRGILSLLVLLPFVSREIPFLFHKRSLSLHFRCLIGALAAMCLYWTLGHTSATHGSFMNSLAPFFMTLLAFKFSPEKPSRVQLLAIALILGGSAFVAGSPELGALLMVWVVEILGAFLQAVAMLFLKSSTGNILPVLSLPASGFICVLSVCGIRQ
ncbi:MAG: EamA family transporter [Nitrosospira sp.]|nr:EamA family transporter [Nitrosospira sp.]